MPAVSYADALGRETAMLCDAERQDAAMLLAFACGRSRAWLLAHGADPIESGELDTFQTLCRRRARGEPVAYLTASAWFCGREFFVDERVLIPRPETEHLAEDAVRFLQGRKARVLDIGTGSGALACTVACEIPNAGVDAVDISNPALTVARINATRHEVNGRVEFHLGDLLDGVSGRAYDAVVANLPYVPAMDIAPKPSGVAFEPRVALDGGPDGLDLYRRLLAGLPAALRPGGAAFLEAAPPTIDALAAVARDAFPGAVTSVEYDYGGRGRYVKVVTPN